jgi:hypothetical protein
MHVRASAFVPVLFLVGLGIGFALFQRPAPAPGTEARNQDGKASSSSAQPSRAESTSTDEKAQRLVAAALRKGREIDRLSELYLAIQSLTAGDFRRLLLDAGAIKAMIEKLQGLDWETSRYLASGLVDRWLTVDPDSIVTWAPRVLELIPKKEQVRGLILDVLAEKRPEALLALVPSQKGSEQRAEIISRALRELASKDLAKAKAWLNACTDPADRRVAETAIRFGIVKADPLRAIELANAIDNRQESYNLIRTAAEEAGKMGAGVLRQLATLPMKSWMLSSVLQEFASSDPDLAVDLALKSLSDNDTSAHMFSLDWAFSSLARRDPAQAIAKLDGLSGQHLASAVSAIGGVWASRDPVAALNWLMEKPVEERMNPHRSGYGSSDSLFYTFSDWITYDRNGARSWADALPPGETRDKLQTLMARVLANRGEVADATQVLFRLGRATDPKALSDIAGAWARTDPQAAADWAIAQPAGPMQSRALASVVGAWANDDPIATKDWLTQFPPGEARDRSIAAFLLRSSSWTDSLETHVAEFNAWFESIEDPWQRAVVARRSYWERRDRDPQGARTWLVSLPNVDPAVIRMTLRYDD